MSGALEIHDVWKAFPDWTGQPRTLRGALTRRAPLVRGRAPRRWALRDVSLGLAAGRGVGVVGHNGSGKSTLLRLIAGLSRPTRGTIRADPDTAAVLTLGASFDLQLTGRENALTAALIAGLRRRDAQRALEAMLEFSELGDFVDAPVRTYSEGMKLRLAFSLVATMTPRLLVLDEVLAVGDVAFREKCLARIGDLRAGGTALVLASHSADEIRGACEEALWLHHGAVRAYGEADAVLSAYERAMHDATLAATPVGVGAGTGAGPLTLGENRFGSQELTIASVAVVGSGDGEVRQGGRLRVVVELRALDGAAVDDPIVTVTVRGADEVKLIDLSTRDGGLRLGSAVRHATVELALERIDLNAGRYTLDVGAFDPSWERALDFHYKAYPLRVHGATSGSAVLPPHSWNRTA